MIFNSIDYNPVPEGKRIKYPTILPPPKPSTSEETKPDLGGKQAKSN